MTGRYETIIVGVPTLAEDEHGAIITALEATISEGKGTLIRTDAWGKRKLAYEVKKQLKGIYLYWQYLGTAGVVEEIERNLRMLDTVIRYYTVKVDEDIDPAARPQGVDEEAFIKAATTVPDEEALVNTYLYQKELKSLIKEAVEETIQDILGDPDEGLQLREEVIQKLKEHKASRKARITMDDIVRKYGLELK